MHCSPRFVGVFCYYNWFWQQKVQKFQLLYLAIVTLNMLLNAIENFCLLLLTCISSTEDYSELVFTYMLWAVARFI